MVVVGDVVRLVAGELPLMFARGAVRDYVFIVDNPIGDRDEGVDVRGKDFVPDTGLTECH